MADHAIIAESRTRMEVTLGSLDKELKGLRTGRANPAMLDTVVVEVYGAKMPITQLATVHAPESRMLSVQVWDKGNVQAVEKAIGIAGLGLNPMSDGTLIRIPIPSLNEERRKELCKVAAKYAEGSRIAIRNIRRDGMDKVKKQEKDGGVSKDQSHDLGEALQKLTDEMVKRVDEMLVHKEKDIMEV